MVMPHLPNEILTIIVGELALQDTEDTPVVEDLTSCRLASHLLCSLATPLLFSSIELQHEYRLGFSEVEQNFKDRAMSLNQILANNNHIATSVQNLELEHYRSTFQDSITSALIANIIHRLTHVRDFTLGCVGTGSDYLTEFPADVKAAIQALCSSSNLRALAFLHIDNIPITLFTTGPNLRRLRFRWIGPLYDDVDESSSQHPFQLDSLVIDGHSYSRIDKVVTSRPSLAEYFSRLKNLQTDLFYKDVNRTLYDWDIVTFTSQTLTRLDIRVNVFSHIMTLGQFPALRHFKIQPLVSLKDHAIMLHFLKQLLSISSPNTTGSHIETLTIEITWTDLVEEWTDFGHGRDLFSSDAEWSALDEALTSGKYVSLHKVVWVFRLEKLGDKWEDEEFEKSSTLSCVNALFPMFKALLNTGRTLETNLELI